MRTTQSDILVQRSLCAWVLSAALLGAVGLGRGVAQIDRPFEPLVVCGDSTLSAAMLDVERMRLWAFRAQQGLWELVPSQVDEVNPKVRPWDRYFVSEDSLHGVFDLDDELVVMARDLGQKADTTQWPPTSDSLRFELAFFDSLDGSTGYLYLHWAAPTAEVPTLYELAYDSASDNISTLAYQVGFNGTGQLADVFLSAEVGGAGIDLFDRFKLRAIASWVIFPIYLDEDLFVAERAYARVGPVRVVRNLDARFKGKIGPVDVDRPFTQTVLFYPYSASFELPPLPLDGAKEIGVNVSVLRASWDMNANAAGMRFFSAGNMAGVIVDGQKDQINASCSPGKLNWTLLTGAQGTVLNIFRVPELGDKIELYYHDATDGTTADRHVLSRDTGDMLSYGDNGFLLSGNIQNYFGPGVTFSVGYTNYFLPPNVPPEQAAKMCEQAEHPLQCTVTLQRRASSPSGVTTSGVRGPRNFGLVAWPNPCNGATTICFQLERQQRVVVDVYDVHGRWVTRLAEGERTPGSHALRWEIQSGQGQGLPSGLYFVRLTAGASAVVQKVLLVR